jgi:hypothetical protein
MAENDNALSCIANAKAPGGGETQRMRRIISALTGLILGTTIGVVGVQAPALAIITNCPAGTACIYTGTDGAGTKKVLAFSVYGYNNCYNLDSTFNNKVKSAISTYGSGYNLQLWTDAGCGGIGHDVSGMGGDTHYYGDHYMNFSSFRIY